MILRIRRSLLMSIFLLHLTMINYVDTRQFIITKTTVLDDTLYIFARVVCAVSFAIKISHIRHSMYIERR